MTSAKRHYLDVLRAIAALAVFVSHADHAQLVDVGLSSDQKWFLGQLGVTVFFVLSGYLIWKSAKAQPLPEYAIHRVTRLVPLLWVNIAFCALVLPSLTYAFSAELHPSTYTVLRHLFATQNISPIVSRDLNPVLWTLTHEALFYALAPVLVLLRPGLVVGIALAAFVTRWMLPTPFWNFQYMLSVFVVGVLLAEDKPFASALFVLVLAAMRFKLEGLMACALIPASFLLMTLALYLPNRYLWMTTPLRWVGVISYSLYIWHYIVLGLLGTEPGVRWIYSVFGEPYHNGFVRGVATTLFVLALSTLSYWLIERPSMTTLRDWLMRIRRPLPTQALQQTQPGP